MADDIAVDPEETRQVEAHVAACKAAIETTIARFDHPLVSAVVIAIANLEARVLSEIEDAEERAALIYELDHSRTQIRAIYASLAPARTRSVIVKGTKH
ncbi:hypothetical protein DEM27_00010 [Metarhizobium album]|uniref:Uncharacterized protein n=1 Tax=Metarhizobium album TaxID=2182425 RepID=A0A2U2DWF3_9HYPH|nr:hypothetical protein [Rhizobium album]PWE57636.1 hypothetical protein DEM27_00010 [Rhizobium album]